METDRGRSEDHRDYIQAFVQEKPSQRAQEQLDTVSNCGNRKSEPNAFPGQLRHKKPTRDSLTDFHVTAPHRNVMAPCPCAKCLYYLEARCLDRFDLIQFNVSPTPVAAGVPPAVEPGIMPGGKTTNMPLQKLTLQRWPAGRPPLLQTRRLPLRRITLSRRHFSLVLLLCLGFTVTASELPKILIAKDGRTFVTDQGKPFVPFGVTYYRPGTGWAPQVWKQFDPEVTRKDFALMKSLGVHCVRVFLSFGSFYQTAGQLEQDGLRKFDQFLAIAEQAGVYVHPTGPDHWEGPPKWSPVAVEDEETVRALESFWRLFAARYHGRHVIFGYDLRNEPEVGWDENMKPKWNDWLRKKYGSQEKLVRAWRDPNKLSFGVIPIPPARDALKDLQLLDFQSFREDLADEWTRRQAAAIKSVDPQALVTVGLIQWSVPSLLPAGPQHYSAFRPARQAKYLDFLEIHFYPLEHGAYEYRDENDELANLAYLEGVVRETARAGKPVVLAEFGWYGGGKPRFDNGAHPPATEAQHARYCRRVVEVSKGFVVGWLNWGFYDQPEAGDCSELTGLVHSNGTIKEWGKDFQKLAHDFNETTISPTRIGARPQLDWDAWVTSARAGNDFRHLYLQAFLADWRSRSH